MSRKAGRVKRIVSRFFKERQIYHRSDGVVHFISMSSKTQIALAAVALSALLWVAYASVNVVFKEQIIVAKERDSRIMQTTYTNQIQKQMKAYDDVNSLNFLLKQEFDATMSEISSRHQTLKSMVERKSDIQQKIDALAKGLSEAGAPDGRKPVNGNRVMIDVKPAEATPRQSRLSVIRKEAAEEAARESPMVPQGTPAAEAVEEMEKAATDLYVEQMLLLASLEERATERIKELRLVLASTGVSPEEIVPPAKIANLMLAQGGPYIDASNLSDASTKFFRHANRVGLIVDELTTVEAAISRVPLSSPLTVARRFTSGFGVRRDPFNGKPTGHYGIDFAAAWASPVTATATGTVQFAGTKSGWGQMVEINHGNGFVTRYAHMSRITVKAGQKVKLHDKVGELGSSGRSTGAHVHYEVIYNGKQRNPRRFIEAGRYVFES